MISKQQIDLLLEAMLSDYISVSDKRNPVFINLENLSNEGLIRFIEQYSLFPKHIISFLVHGAYTLGYYKWVDVAAELRDNITEELGSAYGKISKEQLPHYSILRKSVKEGLQLDLNNAQPTQGTSNFIHSMTAIMDVNNPSQVAGAAYALEATAIPELEIVYEITREIFEREQKKMPQLLIDFFEFHIDEIEVQHRDRMIDEINKYLNSEEEKKDFVVGFKEVMLIMDEWWQEMYNEISRQGENVAV